MRKYGSKYSFQVIQSPYKQMSAEASGLRRVEVGSEASSNLNLLSPVPGEGFTPPPSLVKENFSKPLGLITSLGRGSPSLILLEPSWGQLEGSWSCLEPSGAVVRPSGALLGCPEASRSLLERSWSRLGASWNGLGDVWKPLGALLEPS